MKKENQIKKVAVIGCGFIGYSWGVVFARNGIDVAMYNRKSETLDTVMCRIEDTLNFLLEEKVIAPEDVKEALGHVTVTDQLQEALKDADYVQECLWEDALTSDEVVRVAR